MYENVRKFILKLLLHVSAYDRHQEAYT